MTEDGETIEYNVHNEATPAMACRVNVPAAAGISEHSCSRVDGLSLQLLHLLQQRLPHGAPHAAKRDQREKGGEGTFQSVLGDS